MPKVQYRSNCKPSTFAYPPALEVPKEKEKEKVRAEEELRWSGDLRELISLYIDTWIILNQLIILLPFHICYFRISEVIF